MYNGIAVSDFENKAERTVFGNLKSGKIRIYNGIDRIEYADKYLKGKRLGLLTAASGVNKEGRPTYDILSERYKLGLLFAPEHGIRSNHQDGKWDESNYDKETGAAVFNLNSKGCEDIEGALALCDAVVYDIQDVGARFYTYLYNLTYIMKECALRKKPVVILDRINPINIAVCGGSFLDESKYSSFIGRYNIPTRYGLTIGELAGYFNTEKSIGCELCVVPCEIPRRDFYADETDALWVNPSPNIPSVGTAINYIGTCIFEATNISEGRGTTRPFDLIGAPFIDSAALCRDMCSLQLPGVVFRRAFFTPQFNKWAGEVCEGVELHITDRGEYDPFRTAVELLAAIKKYPETEIRDNSLYLRIGNDRLGDILNDGGAENRQALEGFFADSESYCKAFERSVSQFLIY